MMFLQQRFAWFSTANNVFGEELRFAFCLEAARCFFWKFLEKKLNSTS